MSCGETFFSIEVGIEDLNQAIEDLKSVSDIQRRRVIELERDNEEMRQRLARIKT